MSDILGLPQERAYVEGNVPEKNHLMVVGGSDRTIGAVIQAKAADYDPTDSGNDPFWKGYIVEVRGMATERKHAAALSDFRELFEFQFDEDYLYMRIRPDDEQRFLEALGYAPSSQLNLPWIVVMDSNPLIVSGDERRMVLKLGALDEQEVVEVLHVAARCLGREDFIRRLNWDQKFRRLVNAVASVLPAAKPAASVTSKIVAGR